jgi:ribonucleoside-diphosphate reductase alpha chain
VQSRFGQHQAHLREDGGIDHDKLKATVTTLMRMLDNVIDINFYPVPAAANANLRHRPVGLGVMGLQDALYEKGVAFDSPEAVDFNDEIIEAIAFYAYGASSDLAGERGKYQSYTGSKWDRGLLPLDTLELLEKERGQTVLVDRNARMPWAELREKVRRQGMRNSTAWRSHRPRRFRTFWAARRVSSPCTSTSTRSRISAANSSARTITS